RTQEEMARRRRRPRSAAPPLRRVTVEDGGLRRRGAAAKAERAIAIGVVRIRRRHLLIVGHLPRDTAGDVPHRLAGFAGPGGVRRVEQRVLRRIEVDARDLLPDPVLARRGEEPEPVFLDRSAKADTPVVQALDLVVLVELTRAERVIEVVRVPPFSAEA